MRWWGAQHQLGRNVNPERMAGGRYNTFWSASFGIAMLGLASVGSLSSRRRREEEAEDRKHEREEDRCLAENLFASTL